MRTFIKIYLVCLFLIATQAHIGLACTCFTLDTPDGPIYGSNLDLFFPGDGLVFINQRGIAKVGLSAGTTGKTAEWVSKYGSVTFNLAGREFAFGGMNEAGLVIGSMELRAGENPEPDQRPPLTIGTWAQYVLDTCESIEEVIQVDSKVRIEDQSIPVHFLIADAKGNCVAIEYIDGSFVSRTGDDLPAKAMSNMTYEHALAALEMGGPRWWWSNPGQSAERFATAHERNKSYDANRDPDAVKYAFETLTHLVAAPHTKWNIVYDIAKREVWYRSVASPTVKHISLKEFDLSGKAPLLMLDVNAAIEGDLHPSSFQPYDHDKNLAVLRTLCERYGLELPEEVAIGIIQTFESFKCATEDAP